MFGLYFFLVTVNTYAETLFRGFYLCKQSSWAIRMTLPLCQRNTCSSKTYNNTNNHSITRGFRENIPESLMQCVKTVVHPHAQFRMTENNALRLIVIYNDGQLIQYIRMGNLPLFIVFDIKQFWPNIRLYLSFRRSIGMKVPSKNSQISLI